ncbi:SDR family oxidoreductase [Odoribacter sp. OttesenSCG-928-L07]|nr:SDR family oxidoreductase [Odoribacter sp. OttesenSCG-928-L07]MDL2239181.1 SDR family oxidoreductase [Bacteroidales bacterium OttesenSCG-928-L14]MDL2240525.1 SDR family oxidoreductase [Bacteroidales bacterium OttesenSCG-928-K22]
MNKIVLVTGATSGFGEAIAEIYAKNGLNVIITGRRKERLELLKSHLENNYQTKILALNFDVRDKNAVFNAINSLPEEWKNIDILINNAGLALGSSPIQEGNIDDWETMIDTNVKGLLYVTKAVAPVMIKNNKGHIVNIGSTAGKEAYPGGNVYCGSKHAVQGITDGMRQDLVQYGIKVTQICPGMAETEFSLVRFKGDKEKADNVYKGVTPLTAEDVAQVTFFVTSGLAQHVEIRDLVMSCQQQANSFVVHRKSE